MKHESIAMVGLPSPDQHKRVVRLLPASGIVPANLRAEMRLGQLHRPGLVSPRRLKQGCVLTASKRVFNKETPFYHASAACLLPVFGGNRYSLEMCINGAEAQTEAWQWSLPLVTAKRNSRNARFKQVLPERKTRAT